MISVIIPLYNKAAQVAETLGSVRNQRFTSFEVIIVDDGSQDGSLSVVYRYLQSHPDLGRKTRIFTQPHVGVSAARNRGIAESRFEWIAFLDADDCWTPEYLQEQYSLSIAYPVCDVLVAGYGFRRGPGSPTPVRLSRLAFRTATGIINNYFEVASCSYPPMTCLITMVRKEALETVGGFPVGVASGEDLLTFARLALFYRIAYNRKCLAVYDQDPARQNEDQRRRMPAAIDAVGNALQKMWEDHSWVPGLKEYVGVWHKMRARIFLSKSMRREAWAEWRMMVRFRPADVKTWIYLLLLMTPVKL